MSPKFSGGEFRHSLGRSVRLGGACGEGFLVAAIRVAQFIAAPLDFSSPVGDGLQVELEG